MSAVPRWVQQATEPGRSAPPRFSQQAATLLLDRWGEWRWQMDEMSGYPSMSPEARANEHGRIMPGPRMPRIPHALLGITEQWILDVDDIVYSIAGDPDPLIAQAGKVVYLQHAGGLPEADAMRRAKITSATIWADRLRWGRSIFFREWRRIAHAKE